MTKAQKKKLIELRCKAWGITEDEYYCNQCSDFSLEDMARAYRRGKNKGRAEPRERQIQIDAEQIRALQKQNGELTDELKALRESVKDYGAKCYENGLRNGKRKLEQQIEKMRNCANCKNYNGNEGFCVLGSGYGYNCNLEKWEIKEK